MSKELTESLEKYLLAIYELSKTGKNIKVKNVSEYLNIGGPSTADAIKALREKGVVNYVPYGNISLTEKGASFIEIKKYRHNTIFRFLNEVLGINQAVAQKNTSAIEYSMTEDVLIRFVHFLDFMGQCSCKEPKWMNSCRSALENGQISSKCLSCSSEKNSCGCCCKK